MEEAELRAFINRQRYGVISSIAGDGTPQSALVGLAAAPGLRVIFDTLKETRKYANLLARPECSLVIGWNGEQTLQMEGLVEEPCGAALGELRGYYFEVWPECRAHLAWPSIAYLVVQPRWLRFSDFDQKPPRVEERLVGG